MKCVRSTAVCLMVLAGVSQAAIQTKEIDYSDGDVPLRGVLFWDDALATPDAKAPGVMIVHEWWGLNDYVKSRAKQVAELGYVAFAADMYGVGVVTTDPAKAGELAGAASADREKYRARAMKGLQVLKNQPMVDPDRMAAMGYCFGGTVALETARAGAPLSGVVSFHGGLGTTMPAEKGLIKAKVLVLHGMEDPMVPSEQVIAFAKEMKDADVDYQINAYGHALHAFTNPDADKLGMAPVGYNAEADKRSWEAMKAFFAEIFRG